MGYQLLSHISYTTYVIQLIISCIQLFYYLLATFHIMQSQQVLLKICTKIISTQHFAALDTGQTNWIMQFYWLYFKQSRYFYLYHSLLFRPLQLTSSSSIFLCYIKKTSLIIVSKLSIRIWTSSQSICDSYMGVGRGAVGEGREYTLTAIVLYVCV